MDGNGLVYVTHGAARDYYSNSIHLEMVRKWENVPTRQSISSTPSVRPPFRRNVPPGFYIPPPDEMRVIWLKLLKLSVCASIPPRSPFILHEQLSQPSIYLNTFHSYGPSLIPRHYGRCTALLGLHFSNAIFRHNGHGTVTQAPFALQLPFIKLLLGTKCLYDGRCEPSQEREASSHLPIKRHGSIYLAFHPRLETSKARVLNHVHHCLHLVGRGT